MDEQRRAHSKVEFLSNPTLQRAVVRSLEVIGEAVKKLPPDFRDQHPGVAWRQIAAMRDRLIHGYFSVDYEIVWDAVERYVPGLRSSVIQILAELDRND